MSGHFDIYAFAECLCLKKCDDLGALLLLFISLVIGKGFGNPVR
jgi:hypothetical protein